MAPNRRSQALGALLALVLWAAACGPPREAAVRTVEPTPGTPSIAPTPTAGTSTTTTTTTTTTSSTTSTTAPAPLAADDDGDGLVQIVLWGDSLAFESRDVFLATVGARPELVAETQTFGGVAICDFLDDMAARAAGVEVALLEFSGNAWWTCMLDPVTHQPPGGRAVLERYEADLTVAVDTLVGAGAEVVLIGAPAMAAQGAGGQRHEIEQLYRRFAEGRHGVTFVDAGASVEAGGTFTPTLPCLPFEDASLGCQPDGRIPVRAPDGVHLCPSGRDVDPFFGRCDVWSSGAHRYGTAMARAAIAAAGLPGEAGGVLP